MVIDYITCQSVLSARLMHRLLQQVNMKFGALVSSAALGACKKSDWVAGQNASYWQHDAGWLVANVPGNQA
jgi:hypothetical protein